MTWEKWSISIRWKYYYLHRFRWLHNLRAIDCLLYEYSFRPTRFEVFDISMTNLFPHAWMQENPVINYCFRWFVHYCIKTSSRKYDVHVIILPMTRQQKKMSRRKRAPNIRHLSRSRKFFVWSPVEAAISEIRRDDANTLERGCSNNIALFTEWKMQPFLYSYIDII